MIDTMPDAPATNDAPALPALAHPDRLTREQRAAPALVFLHAGDEAALADATGATPTPTLRPQSPPGVDAADVAYLAGLAGAPPVAPLLVPLASFTGKGDDALRGGDGLRLWAYLPRGAADLDEATLESLEGARQPGAAARLYASAEGEPEAKPASLRQAKKQVRLRRRGETAEPTESRRVRLPVRVWAMLPPGVDASPALARAIEQTYGPTPSTDKG